MIRPTAHLGAVVMLIGSSASLLGWSPAGTGSTVTTRVVDRTLLCSTVVDPLGRRILAITVSPKSASTTRAALTLLAVGKTRSEVLVSVHPLYTLGPGVAIRSGLCRPTRTRVPLSATALPGTPTRFSTSDRCSVSRQILLRVRATLTSWKGWARVPSNPQEPGKRDLEFARGSPVGMSLAVRTSPAQKPVAFASIDREGRSQLFLASSPRCGVP